MPFCLWNLFKNNPSHLFVIKYVLAKCLIGAFSQLQSKKIYFSIDVTNSKEQRPIKNRVWFQFYHYRLRHSVSITNSWKMRQWLKVASLCFLDALLAKFSEVKTLVMETAQQGFFTSMSHGSLKKKSAKRCQRWTEQLESSTKINAHKLFRSQFCSTVCVYAYKL